MTTSNSILRATAPAAVSAPSTGSCRAAFRNLSTVLCVAVLALGLAGCGGGGGGQRSDSGADLVKDAIEAAETAVEALTSTSTTTQVRLAESAVEAAKTAVADAGGISDAVREAHNRTISLIERILDDALERITMTRGDEVGKLTTALEADRIGAVSATVEHGAAPTLGGTVPGTPASTVTGLATTAVPGSTSSTDGWTGGTYTAADEAAGISDEVAFHTDIEAPGMQPFSGETGKYGTADGIDADGNLAIGSTTDATLIASSDFPTGPGIVTHAAGQDGVAEVTGTFDDAQGTYVCTPAMDNGCTSSIRSGGGIALAGGAGWKFVPDEGAMVTKTDTEYRYFGWWLRKAADDSYSVGAFHGGVGGDAQDFANLSQLQGTATYSGPAAGKFVFDSGIGPAEAGEFTAETTLEVDFGDDSALGTVTGTVDGFVANGTARQWSVELRSAAIGAGGTITAGGSSTARTVWSIAGEPGAATGSPIWGGQFHDVDETQLPNAATGTFESTYGDLGRMTGAFGTTQQEPQP